MPPRSSPFEKVGADRLQGRYRDPNISGIRFRIEKQADNALPDIQVR
jgi:hypothetical protein